MSSISGKTCTVDNCQKPLACRGMCQAHYMAFLRAGGKKVNVGGVCAIEGCKNKYFAKGYCRIHFLRISRHGTPDRVYEDHGMRHTDEYRIWCNIRQRCTNQNSKNYEGYGKRGIHMAQEWLDSFKVFYDYMGPRPSSKHSVERIDNELGYQPGNVRWATQSIQGHNQRIRRTNTTGYKGIHWRKDSRKWAAAIACDGVSYHLGLFDTKEEAAKAYNKKAIELYGKYAHLNIIEDDKSQSPSTQA